MVSDLAVESAKRLLNEKSAPINLNYNDPNSYYHEYDLNFAKNVANLTKIANNRDVANMNLIDFNVLIDQAEAQQAKNG